MIRAVATGASNTLAAIASRSLRTTWSPSVRRCPKPFPRAPARIGELGKEVAIELQRFGVEVIAADRYADAPAMQVAHRSHVLDMLDGAAIRALVALERPHLIVPEIEAIHTQTLVELEHEFAERGQPPRASSPLRARPG